MDRTERFYKIELLIRTRGSVPFVDLMEELGVSRATLKRDLEYLRERMDAPIVYERDSNGYRFSAGAGRGGAAAARHELPGLWFSEREIHALLTMHQLIGGLDEGGVLARHLQPLLDKLYGMLGTSDDEARELVKRIKVMAPARRPVAPKHFELIGGALTRRQRVHLHYWVRSRREMTERTVSPQRLVHWRSTWYLDAWCHATDALRRFALDAIREVSLVATPRAKDVALKTIEAELDAGYGAFSGARVQWATLEFTPEAAQWVRHEQWHAQQEQKLHGDGSLTLRVPYADATELAMDILRHGEQVRVLGPAALAAAVQGRLQRAAARYQDKPGPDRPPARGSNGGMIPMSKAQR